MFSIFVFTSAATSGSREADTVIDPLSEGGLAFGFSIGSTETPSPLVGTFTPPPMSTVAAAEVVAVLGV
jgi:hypothetical protein